MGKTPKMFSYAKKGEIKSLKKSVPAKHKVTEEEPDTKRTLLHYAAEGAKIQVAEYLLSLPGIVIDARDSTGETPLHVALRFCKASEIHEDFAVLLVRNGADIYADAKKDWKTPAKLVEETNNNRFRIKWKEAVQFVSRQRANSNPKAFDEVAPAVSATPVPVTKPPVNVLTSPIPSPPQPIASPSNTTTAKTPTAAMPSLDELMDQFTIKQAPEPVPEPDVLQSSVSTTFRNDFVIPATTRDLYTLWYDVASVIAELVSLEANISNIISSKRIETVALAINDLLTEMKEGDLKNEKFTSFQRTKINDAMDALPERLGKLQDCVRLMSFSKADHTDVAKVSVPLVGALYWLFVVVEQVSKEDVTKSIGSVAVGAKTSMSEVAVGGVPKGILPLATALIISLSRRIFETKDPAICLQLSDCCHNIAKSVKSLILLPMFAGSSADGVQTLAKGIADHLQTIKAVNINHIPSRTGPPLTLEAEKEVYATAYKQLSVALEFYLSNADKVPLPYPNRLVPLFKQILARMRSLPSVVCAEPLDVIKLSATAKSLASSANSMRNLFVEHRVDFEEDEEHWKNLLTALNGAAQFGIQLLIASSCTITKNRICTRGHLGYATRGLAFCTTVIIDTFCLDL